MYWLGVMSGAIGLLVVMVILAVVFEDKFKEEDKSEK